MTSATEAESHCAHCGEAASARCKGCQYGLEIYGKPSPTIYCSKQCQTAHWKTHKLHCKAANYRKQLYRTGDLAQTIFFNARRAAFDIKVEKVVEKNGRLYVDEGRYGSNEILVAFPEGVFATREDEEAILAWNSCAEAASRMGVFVSSALKGSCKSIREVGVLVPTERLRVIFTGKKKSNTLHGLLKVDLEDGNSYALDLSGAQYGHHKSVTPWQEYCKEMVVYIIDSSKLGSSANADARNYKHLVRSKLEPGQTVGWKHEEMINYAQYNVTRLVVAATQGWARDHFNAGLAGMMVEDDSQFSKDSKTLVSGVKGYVELFIEWIKDIGMIKVLGAYPDLVVGFLEWADVDNDELPSEHYERRLAAGTMGHHKQSWTDEVLSGSLRGLRIAR